MRQPLFRIAAVAVVCSGVAACNTTKAVTTEDDAAAAEISETTKFAAVEYGVPASERVTTSKSVPKGGGREMVGKPYKVRGKWYTPAEDPDYNKSGLASWYGPNFHGRKTANGEIFDQYHLSAAHPTFPLPSYARVTNETNGNSVIVRVNDRGPFAHNRIIDVSSKAADLLDFKSSGVAKVNVQYVGPARMDGHDMPYLMATYRPAGDRGPVVAPEGVVASGVMLAMTETSPAMPGVASDALAAQPALVPAANDAVTEAPAPAVVEDVPATTTVTLSLPQTGPLPPERPAEAGIEAVQPAPGQTLSAAYAAERIVASSAPFQRVLQQDRDALTSAAIVGAWKRRMPSDR
ncbi:septal ring lytic transglycosylase RlpA family protein [Pararhizobium haloflavum]|uniref:septal ring lytic transglycosylase RlpA family protein n=1 Tax=Pararhizobium haloflavum TaxID=2037914 RepID=UPI000C17D9FF|nr:septal ring lytic transglycosylase RlpA family protein [Pararhizobium haloflavum]